MLLLRLKNPRGCPAVRTSPLALTLDWRQSATRRAFQARSVPCAPEFVALLVIAARADVIVIAVEPVVFRRRLKWVKRRDAQFSQVVASALRGDRQDDFAGGLAVLDPLGELRHELHRGRGVAVDFLSARA